MKYKTDKSTGDQNKFPYQTINFKLIVPQIPDTILTHLMNGVIDRVVLEKITKNEMLKSQHRLPANAPDV